MTISGTAAVSIGYAGGAELVVASGCGGRGDGAFEDDDDVGGWCSNHNDCQPLQMRRRTLPKSKPRLLSVLNADPYPLCQGEQVVVATITTTNAEFKKTHREY